MTMSIIERYSLRLEFITGVMFGFEYISYEDLGEEGDGWVFMVDLVIFRVLLEKLTAVNDV